MTLHAGDKALRLRASSSKVSPLPTPSTSPRAGAGDEAGPSRSAAVRMSTSPSKSRRTVRSAKVKQQQQQQQQQQQPQPQQQERIRETLRQQQQPDQDGLYGTQPDDSMVIFTPGGLEGEPSSFLNVFPLGHLMTFSRIQQGQESQHATYSGSGVNDQVVGQTARHLPFYVNYANWLGLGLTKQGNEQEEVAAKERSNEDPLLPDSPIRTQSQASRFQDEVSKQDAAAAQGDASTKLSRKKVKKQKSALRKAAREKAEAHVETVAQDSKAVPSSCAEQQQRPSSSCNLASRISHRVPDLLTSSSVQGSPAPSSCRLSVTSHHTALSQAASLSSEQSGKLRPKRKRKPRKDFDIPVSSGIKSPKGSFDDAIESSSAIADAEQRHISVEEWVEASFDATRDVSPSTPPPNSMPIIEVEAPTPLLSQTAHFAASKRAQSPSPNRRRSKESSASGASSPDPRNARLRREYAPLRSSTLQIDTGTASGVSDGQTPSRSPVSNVDTASITPLASPCTANGPSEVKPSKRSLKQKKKREANDAEARAQSIAKVVAAAERGAASTPSTLSGKAEQSRAGAGRQPKIAVQTSTPPRVSPTSAVDGSPSTFFDCSPSTASVTPSSVFARRQNSGRPASRCSSRARHPSKTETEMSFVTAKAGTSSSSPLSEEALMFSPEDDQEHQRGDSSGLVAAADDSMVAQIASPPQASHVWSSSVCSHETPRPHATPGECIATAASQSLAPPSALPAANDGSSRLSPQVPQRNRITVDEEGSLSWDSPADKTATSAEWTHMTHSASVGTVTSQTPTTSIEDPDKTSSQDQLVHLAEKSERSWWSRQAATTPTAHERVNDEITMGLGLSIGDLPASSPSIVPPSTAFVTSTPHSKQALAVQLESRECPNVPSEHDETTQIENLNSDLTPTDEAVHERNVRLMRTRVWAHSGPYSPPRFEENLFSPKGHAASSSFDNGALLSGVAAMQLCRSTSSISALTLDGSSSKVSGTEFIYPAPANPRAFVSRTPAVAAPSVPRTPTQDPAALALLQSRDFTAAQRDALLSIVLLHSFKLRREYAQQRRDAQWDQALANADEEMKRHLSYAEAKKRLHDSIVAMPDFKHIHAHRTPLREHRLGDLAWVGMEDYKGNLTRYAVEASSCELRPELTWRMHVVKPTGAPYGHAHANAGIYTTPQQRIIDELKLVEDASRARRVVSSTTPGMLVKTEQTKPKPADKAQSSEALALAPQVTEPSATTALPATAPVAIRKFFDDESQIAWPSSPAFAHSALNLSLSPESSVASLSSHNGQRARPIAATYGETSSSYSPVPSLAHQTDDQAHALQPSPQSHAPWLSHFDAQPVSSPGAMSLSMHDPFSLAYLQEKRGGDRAWLAGLESISEQEKEAIEDFFVTTDRLWRDQVGDLAGEPEYTTPAQFEKRRAATENSNSSRATSTRPTLYGQGMASYVTELERSTMPNQRTWAPRQHGSFASSKPSIASRYSSREPGKSKARSDTYSIAAPSLSRSASPVNSRPSSPRLQQSSERKARTGERHGPLSSRPFKSQRSGYANKYERAHQYSPKARRGYTQCAQAEKAAQALQDARNQQDQEVARYLAVARAAVIQAEISRSSEAAIAAQTAQNHAAMVELYSEALASPNHSQQVASHTSPSSCRDVSQALGTPDHSPQRGVHGAKAPRHEWARNFTQYQELIGRELTPEERYSVDQHETQLQQQQLEHFKLVQAERIAFQIAEHQARLAQLQLHGVGADAEMQRFRREFEEIHGPVSHEEWEHGSRAVQVQAYVSATLNGAFTAPAEPLASQQQQQQFTPKRQQLSYHGESDGYNYSPSLQYTHPYSAHSEYINQLRQEEWANAEQQQSRSSTTPSNMQLSEPTSSHSQSHQVMSTTSDTSEAMQHDDSDQAGDATIMTRSDSSPSRTQLQQLRNQAAAEANAQALQHRQWLATANWPRQLHHQTQQQELQQQRQSEPLERPMHFQRQSQGHREQSDRASAQRVAPRSPPPASNRPAAQQFIRRGGKPGSIRTPRDASAWINSSYSRPWHRPASTDTSWNNKVRSPAAVTTQGEVEAGGDTESSTPNDGTSESTHGGVPGSGGGAAMQSVKPPRWAEVVEANASSSSTLNGNVTHGWPARGPAPHRPYGRGPRR